MATEQIWWIFIMYMAGSTTMFIIKEYFLKDFKEYGKRPTMSRARQPRKKYITKADLNRLFEVNIK